MSGNKLRHNIISLSRKGYWLQGRSCALKNDGVTILNKSFLWQLYITVHTVLFGIPFLFFPNTILPWLGFQPTDEPWIRMVGVLFLVIGTTSYSVYKNKIKEMIIPSIRVRSVVVLIVFYLGIKSHSPFLEILALIILIGVIGSMISYKQEYWPFEPKINGKIPS